MGQSMTKTKYPSVYYYKGKKGKCYYFSYKSQGKQTWEKVGWDHEGITPEVASIKRGERVRQIFLGEAPKSQDSPTVGDGMKEYLTHLLRQGKTKGYSDEKIYNKWLKDTIGNVKLKDLDPKGLDRLRESKWDPAGRAVATNLYNLLSRMINYIIKKNQYKWANPMKFVDWPKQDRFAKKRFYTEDETYRLLDALKKRDEMLWEMALISLNTGMRRGEIIDLQAQDIDFSRGTILIRDVKDSKNKRDRYVRMTPTVKEILETKDFSKPGNTFYHWKQRQFYGALKDSGVNDGITDSRFIGNFHTFRHTFASNLAMKGKALLEIGAALGHTSTDLVVRYAHLSPEAAINVALDVEVKAKREEEGVQEEKGLRLVVNNR